MAKSKGNAARREQTKDQNNGNQDKRTDAEIAEENANATEGTVAKQVDRRVDENGNPRFAPNYKYDTPVAKAREAKLEYNPDWAKRDVEFIAGVKPKGNGTSVMSKLHAMVAGHTDPDSGKVVPIVGKELAVMLRNTDFPQNRSKYTNGIPPVGWAEGYIDGACRTLHGFLKMVDTSKIKRVAPNAGKTNTDGNEAGDAGDKGADGGDAGDGAQNDQDAGNEVHVHPGDTIVVDSAE